MNCFACGQECFENKEPEVVFRKDDICICEHCSIDYEEVDGVIQKRQMGEGKKSLLFQAMVEEVEYMFNDGLFFNYFNENQIKTLEKVYAENRDEIVEKIVNRLFFAEDIAAVFEDYT